MSPCPDCPIRPLPPPLHISPHCSRPPSTLPHSPAAASSPVPLHPGVWRGRVVTCLIVEFAVRAGRRVEVHVVASGFESQGHGAVRVGRWALMHLVLIKALLVVGARRCLEWRVGIRRVDLRWHLLENTAHGLE